MKWKHILGDIEVNRDFLLLLAIGGLYTLAIALSNTFVNIYLWKQTKNFLNLGMYNLAIVVLQPIAFVFAGRLAKVMDRVILLRCGVSVLALFFITVLLVGIHASHYILLIGALLGVGYGFYWLAFHLLTFEITEPETRDFFNGFLGLLVSFAGMVGPIVAGFIISRMEQWNGYTCIFILSLLLFAVAILLSFFLSHRECEGKYELKEVVKERGRNYNWRSVTRAHYFQGIREGTFIFAISVILYITTGSEMAIGQYGLISSAVSFFVYFIVTRFVKKTHRKKAILLGGILLYLSVFLIVFDVTYERLLFYAVCISIAYPILLVPLGSISFDVIGRAWRAKDLRIEYMVIRECYLNLGRICSILLFLAAVMFFPAEKSIPILLSVVGSGHFLIYFVIRNVKYEARCLSEKAMDAR